MKRKDKHAVAIEIGLRLPHSQETIEYIKRNNFALYLILMEIEEKDDVEFSDIMILESSGARGNYYSCPLCETGRLYSAAFGHAKKHFESHLLDLDKILEIERRSLATKFF